MKNILLAFLYLSYSAAIYAQENWFFSPSIGVNLVPVVESNISGTTFKAGMSFAFNSSHLVEKNVSLEYGLSANQRYAAYSYNSVSTELEDLFAQIPLPGLDGFDLSIYENYKGLTTFWTIDAPLTISYRLSSGLFFSGGGYINFLVSARHKEEQTTHIPALEFIDVATIIPDSLQYLISTIPENGTEVVIKDNTENMNNFGFGALIGVGYQTDSWVMRLTYQHGINDIRDDDAEMKIPSQYAVNFSIGLLIQDLFLTSKSKAIYDLDKVE